MRLLGKQLLIVGLLIAGVGLVMMLGVPLGRLPGDISVKRDGFSFYFPLTTCIIVSLALTAVFALFRR